MRKLLLSTCLAASMLCSAATPCALAAETIIESNYAVSEIPVLDGNLDGNLLTTGTGVYRTVDFPLTAGCGDTIRIKFKNTLELPATVLLFQRDKTAENGFKNVFQFTVQGNSEDAKDYTAPGADSQIYFIRIEPRSGAKVEGYIAISQVDLSGQAVLPFIDVPVNAWYRQPVEYVYEKGLFSGTSATTFSPEQDMTRAQIVAILGNMHQKLTGETIESNTPDFSDVPDGAYYAKYIDWAKENGIVAGFTDGKFHPDDIVTREQFAVIVNKYIQVNGKTLTASHEYTPFADENQISSWAKDAVVNMVKYGFMSGKAKNQFAPKDSVIRAEGATVIADLHKTLV